MLNSYICGTQLISWFLLALCDCLSVPLHACKGGLGRKKVSMWSGAEQSRERMRWPLTSIPITSSTSVVLLLCGDFPSIMSTTFYSFKSQQPRKGASEEYSFHIKEFSMVPTGECFELELRVGYCHVQSCFEQKPFWRGANLKKDTLPNVRNPLGRKGHLLLSSLVFL